MFEVDTKIMKNKKKVVEENERLKLIIGLSLWETMNP